jgi:hypothetical protein
MEVKKLILITLSAVLGLSVNAQRDSITTTVSKQQQKREEAQRRTTLARQQEEGVLFFDKHVAGGIQLRTNGYGAFLEIGKARSPRFTNLYVLELTEIKHNKEEKAAGDGLFSNSYVYGKVNNFYQAKLGFGQQYVFGQKGNKNGIAVLGIVHGGLSVGLLKPYYVQAEDQNGARDIKYESADSLLFLNFDNIRGGSGFTKGWGEVKIKPGAYLKTALRFDFGRYNESIHALEIGMSVDFYASKISQMVYNEPKQFFFQGHIAYVFGKRK